MKMQVMWDLLAALTVKLKTQMMNQMMMMNSRLLN